MNTQPIKGNLSSSDVRSCQLTLANWLEAVSHFHTYYHELTVCLNESQSEPTLRRNKMYIGQCPVNQLMALRNTMQEELMKLLKDMQVNKLKQPMSPQRYRKLAAHTAMLNQLNYQAQTRLHLMSLSTL